MPCRRLQLTNKRGLHARAATKLVQCCQPFAARVSVFHGEREADAANIMSLLMLAAPCGTELDVQADGEDADEVLDALTDLFESRFEEDA
ncbi:MULTISPECIES: HPr family phosphocarrier protein [Chromohalobacter]|jgi:phosphocarrier protein NPr|uniref:HPrNtr n=1 Tax=Chromohalobacter israelensis (strain ATCC BAA-138 / DSM 3043 / CIP 106854 / NCIMB 13768 / 1H11) TaxID=290398 RepID=Q1QVC7_CHRI1|nr:HPr family phosphocarrier protein [Chromohalobacter salexigens]ABE59581.1 HPrNtr [Chromohalobacter salexigens DSM 3043]MBZ5874649.1 HPr family phosphocarrier protein [Chromohalobacter salexigens]MDO0946274.1 HPr family phosphocarrier protein [Chromohalobacter salexigens]NWO56982.1 HPr family phosphocarrier protein [Chromohalobacter salexigens]PWW41913.1 phosphocarrier protein NPr [Chromohalobacter salexigens]